VRVAAGSAGRAQTQRDQALLEALRLVHEQPGRTRADVARVLALSSGSATEIAGRMRARHLAAEVHPGASGARGRPSPRLVADESGPLVAVAEVSYAGWRVAVAEIGLNLQGERSGSFASHDPDVVIKQLRRELRAIERRWGSRVRAVSIAVPGIVVAGRVAQAPMLGWIDVDIAAAVPSALADRPVLVANEATLAGMAEARRGVAIDASVSLYLLVGVGLGGVVVERGRPTLGATGGAGEFGHLPFGDPARQCPCGAHGCWGLEVDAGALARSLGRRMPADPTRFATSVFAAAAKGGAAERAAVAQAAAALGRGTAGLVNAVDPDLVVFGGTAGQLLAADRPRLMAAYREGLMRSRRAAAPELVSAALGAASTLVGAAESGLDRVLTAEGLAAWDLTQ
jgi:predicted NBD/HSP70 family sugar kinase